MSTLVFVYGSLRFEEPDHSALDGAESLGGATATGVRLVDLGRYPALIDISAPTTSGALAVVGEVYEVDRALLSRLDLLKQHPALFQRRSLTLEDGRTAMAYMMADEQVRGRKRLRTGDWKKRFEPIRGAEFTAPRRYS